MTSAPTATIAAVPRNHALASPLHCAAATKGNTMTTIDMNELAAVMGGVNWREANARGMAWGGYGAGIGAATGAILGTAAGGLPGSAAFGVIGGLGGAAVGYGIGAASTVLTTIGR